MCFYIRSQRDSETVTMGPPRFDYLARFITKIIFSSTSPLRLPLLLRCLDLGMITQTYRSSGCDFFYIQVLWIIGPISKNRTCTHYPLYKIIDLFADQLYYYSIIFIMKFLISSNDYG